MKEMLEEIKKKIEERKSFHLQQLAFCDNHNFKLEAQLHNEIDNELRDLRFFVMEKIMDLSKLEISA